LWRDAARKEGGKREREMGKKGELRKRRGEGVS
jgi:hypothetical protein